MNCPVFVCVAENLIAVRWWHRMWWTEKVNPFEARYHSHRTPLLSSSLWVFGERPTELSKECSECRRYQSFEEQINWRIDSTQGLPIYITGSTFIDAPDPNAACSTVVFTKYFYSSLLTCMWLKFCDPENPTCCQREMEKNIQTKV